MFLAEIHFRGSQLMFSTLTWLKWTRLQHCVPVTDFPSLTSKKGKEAEFTLKGWNTNGEEKKRLRTV